MDPDKPGEPSRLPVPTRTFANPSRLTVAHRSNPTSTQDEPIDTDAEVLKQSLTHRAKITKKGERWSDKLMEGAVDLQTFKKALSYLTPQQYRDVLHERHLAELCSYPPCPKPSKAPYTTHRRFKISYTRKTVQEKEGNEDEGFCSAQHRVRSEWVETKLSETAVWDRVGRDGLQILEDLELAPKGQPPTLQGGPEAATARPLDRPPSSCSRDTVSDTNREADSKAPWKDRIQPMQDIPTSTSPQSNITDMISSLTIHERPTPTASGPALPVDDMRQERPQLSSATIQSSTQTGTISTGHPGNPTRRTTSSLVATPNKLSATVLSASRKMGTIPQLAPDSDAEEEEGDWGEADMGLEWGEETDEMRALFEEARLARELLEETQKDG